MTVALCHSSGSYLATVHVSHYLHVPLNQRSSGAPKEEIHFQPIIFGAIKVALRVIYSIVYSQTT